MKHNKKITVLLLAMFLVTQLIGIYVVHHYSSPENKLPFGLGENVQPQTQGQYSFVLTQIIIAFVLAIVILLFLSKLKFERVLKVWFFVVVVIALSVSLMAFSPHFKYEIYAAIGISLVLAFFKIFKRNFIIHNLTELLIYPGIASVFVPLLNIWTVIALLILISIYDMWAVWHSGIMQKMAKYQINNVGIFSGFFVPYMSKSQRTKIKTWKKTLKKSDLNKKKVKVNVAILGGGDIVFPIIASGVMLKTLGLIPALIVSVGATLGLAFLFARSEKKKFYPAMPFITSGILIGILVSYVFL